MSFADAMAWIEAKADEFNAAEPRILEGRSRAADVARALPKGSIERAEAGKIVERWSKMLRDFYTARNRYNAIASRVPGLEGLGVLPVVPLAVAAGVIAVAASMALILRKLTAEERALRLLERGRITPAEAIELAANIEGGRAPGLFGALGGQYVMPLALAAGAAFLFLRPR